MQELELMKKLNDSGYESYIIGGFVRDSILGKNPNDADIVTSAKPEEVQKVFQYENVKLVGKSFGVVIVNNIEIATFRKDRYSGLNDKDVEITFSNSLKEDTERRDFTFNALAIDIENNYYDFHNGKKDLKDGLVRFIGDPYERIKEDPNRILRACRFKALIGGTFEKETLKALKDSKELVSYIALERVHKEIMKTMSTVQKASKFFQSMREIGILEYILPSLNNCIGVAHNRFHKEYVFVHNMLCGNSISCKYPLLKLAGYLHDIGKPNTKVYNTKDDDFNFISHEIEGAILAELDLTILKFSNEEVEYVSNLIRHHMLSSKTPKSCRKILRKLDECDIYWKDFVRFKIADRKAKIGSDRFSIEEIKDKVRNFKYVIAKKEPFNIKQLAIDGFDVMLELKINPGPEVGKILNQLFEIVLEDPEMNEREKLIKLMKGE